MRDYFEIGLITTTHGLKGEVKVFVTSDDKACLETVGKVFLIQRDSRQELTIETVRYFKNLAIVKFKGLDRIEDVQGFRGQSLYIDRSQAEPLKDGEYYLSDLYGCEVTLEDGTSFGTVKDVIRTGANDVLVVGRPGKKDALIPVFKDCIVRMAPEEKTIVAHLIKGLVTE